MDGELDAIRERLRAAGASETELAAVTTLQEHIMLAAEIGYRPDGERVSARELARRVGIEPQTGVAFLAAAGLSVEDLDEPCWYSSDVDWMRTASAGCVVFGEDAVLALLRRAGGAMSQLANAASATFRVNMAADSVETTIMEVIERNLTTGPLIDSFVTLFSQLYRYHTRRSFREDSVAAGTYGELRHMAVGFVDLAASTELGARLTAAELARSISDFDAAAYDAATRHGARVVKTIGDAVMLCALDAAAVCAAATDLVAYCARHETFSDARGGVAAGDVLEQDGDCYGPVVNRAARFAAAAPDGLVMVDAAVGDAVRRAFSCEPLPPVEHRGIGLVDWFAVRPVGPDA
ncbi:MAG: adenylate/guanylate cyclase domain-containing protein [Acidimicrobiia bacterium]